MRRACSGMRKVHDHRCVVRKKKDKKGLVQSVPAAQDGDLRLRRGSAAAARDRDFTLAEREREISNSHSFIHSFIHVELSQARQKEEQNKI